MEWKKKDGNEIYSSSAFGWNHYHPSSIIMITSIITITSIIHQSPSPSPPLNVKQTRE